MPVATPKITVLIVDDQRVTRLGLTTVLEEFSDMNIIGEAESGEQAVRSALELAPSIILMDIGMPGMNGIDAVKKIKAVAPHLRVIIFTDSSDDGDILAALSAGADGYCLKECQPMQIATTIRAVNEGMACLDPAIARKILALTNTSPSVEADSMTFSGEVSGSFNKFGLTAQELEIISLIVDGHHNREIAGRLLLSPDKVKDHMRHILSKLAVSDRTQAAVKAMTEGLV